MDEKSVKEEKEQKETVVEEAVVDKTAQSVHVVTENAEEPDKGREGILSEMAPHPTARENKNADDQKTIDDELEAARAADEHLNGIGGGTPFVDEPDIESRSVDVHPGEESVFDGRFADEQSGTISSNETAGNEASKNSGPDATGNTEGSGKGNEGILSGMAPHPAARENENADDQKTRDDALEDQKDQSARSKEGAVDGSAPDENKKDTQKNKKDAQGEPEKEEPENPFHINVSGGLAPISLPRGFNMDTPGILSCTMPVNAQMIRELKDFVDKNRTELELSGLWSEPSVISFSPHSLDDGGNTFQPLDSELAGVISDFWKITRIEARAGALELVPDQNGRTPLNVMSDLSHIHMWGGLRLHGDPDVQRQALITERPMYYSIGVTGDNNRVDDAILSGNNRLGIFAVGNNGVLNIGKNSFANTPVYTNEGPNNSSWIRRGQQDDSIRDMDQAPQPGIKYVPLMDLKNFFLDAVNIVDTKHDNALTDIVGRFDYIDKALKEDEALKEFFARTEMPENVSLAGEVRGAAAAYLGIKENAPGDLDNNSFTKTLVERLSTPMIKEFDAATLEKAMTESSVLDSIGVSSDTIARQGAISSIRDAIKDLGEAKKLPANEQEARVNAIISKHDSFAKIIIRGGIADKLFDNTRHDTLAAIEQMPSGMFAEIGVDSKGKERAEGFRFMNSNAEAYHAAAQRDIDSMKKRSSSLFSYSKELGSMGESDIPSSERADVKASVMNMGALLGSALSAGIEAKTAEMAQAIHRDTKISEEMSRSKEEKTAGGCVVLDTGTSLGTGAFAGNDSSFYGKPGDKDYLFTKTASEMLKQIDGIDRYVVAITDNMERDMAEKIDKGFPVSEESYRNLEALQSVRSQMTDKGPGSFMAKRHAAAIKIKGLANSAKEQKELMNEAFGKATEMGMSPRDFQELQRSIDSMIKAGHPPKDEDVKNNPLVSLLVKFSEKQKNMETLRKDVTTSMQNIYDALADSMVPKEPAIDENGRQLLDENGKAMMRPMLEPEEKDELCSVLFEKYSGIEPIMGEKYKGTGTMMITDVEAKWLTFSHLAGIDGNQVNKVLTLSEGGDLGKAALQNTGITAVEQRREGMYKEEFDELTTRNMKVVIGCEKPLEGIREQLRGMGVNVPQGRSDDWEKVYKPAFDEVLADTSLQPETQEQIKKMAAACCETCKLFSESREWLAKNPNFEEYRCNQSAHGAEINRSIRSIENNLKRDDLSQEQRLALEQSLREKQEEKRDFIESGFATRCHGTVSDEVKNVDLNGLQMEEKGCAFPNAFNENMADGSIKPIDFDYPPMGARLRGKFIGLGNTSVEVAKDVLLNYHHCPVSRTVAEAILMGATIIGNLVKGVAGFFNRSHNEKMMNKGIAHKIVAPLVDLRAGDKAQIIFKENGLTGEILQFSSPQAERECMNKGITLDNSLGHTRIVVDMAKATGGKQTGKATFFGQYIRRMASKGELPKYAAAEEIERRENQIKAYDTKHQDTTQKMADDFYKKKGYKGVAEVKGYAKSVKNEGGRGR